MYNVTTCLSFLWVWVDQVSNIQSLIINNKSSKNVQNNYVLVTARFWCGYKCIKQEQVFYSTPHSLGRMPRNLSNTAR